MNSLESNFGKQLVKLRNNAGLTQQVLAHKSGLSVRAISSLEGGGHGCKFSNLQLIADGLGVEVKELFNFDSI
jgi:transcriptional regulator with XRE-family HTH domain